MSRAGKAATIVVRAQTAVAALNACILLNGMKYSLEESGEIERYEGGEV